jgi:hypothetical protein
VRLRRELRLTVNNVQVKVKLCCPHSTGAASYCPNYRYSSDAPPNKDGKPGAAEIAEYRRRGRSSGVEVERVWLFRDRKASLRTFDVARTWDLELGRIGGPRCFLPIRQAIAVAQAGAFFWLPRRMS